VKALKLDAENEAKILSGNARAVLRLS
jgi:predicted TIM-barrel fold metal-dependent hydrolase